MLYFPLVLTYHSLNISAPGDTYSTNDHVALESDLQSIERLGFKVISIHQLVQLFIKGDWRALTKQRLVAITFDDGANLDYFNYDHPLLPNKPVSSFKNILSRYQHLRLDKNVAYAMATSFVIVSPQARGELDKVCMLGQNEWQETWWQD